jgi:hypothetical protein
MNKPHALTDAEMHEMLRIQFINTISEEARLVMFGSIVATLRADPLGAINPMEFQYYAVATRAHVEKLRKQIDDGTSTGDHDKRLIELFDATQPSENCHCSRCISARIP